MQLLGSQNDMATIRLTASIVCTNFSERYATANVDTVNMIIDFLFPHSAVSFSSNLSSFWISYTPRCVTNLKNKAAKYIIIKTIDMPTLKCKSEAKRS